MFWLTKVCNWIEEKVDNLGEYEHKPAWSMYVKAFCLGALQGFLGIFLIFGALWYVAAVVARFTKKDSFMNVVHKD